MKKVLLLPNDVVYAVSNTAEVEKDGIYMNGVIYAERALRLIDFDGEPIPGRDKIVNGEIVRNEAYYERYTVKIEQLKEELYAKDLENKEAIAEVFEMLIGGV